MMVMWCGFFIIALVIDLFGVFIFTRLWAWFMVPTFNLPPLSIPVAFGIVILISFLVGKSTKEAEEALEDPHAFADFCQKRIGKFLFYWGAGFIITQFM